LNTTASEKDFQQRTGKTGKILPKCNFSGKKFFSTRNGPDPPGTTGRVAKNAGTGAEGPSKETEGVEGETRDQRENRTVQLKGKNDPKSYTYSPGTPGRFPGSVTFSDSPGRPGTPPGH